MTFEEEIKQWVSIDNQLQLLNEKSKDLREKKAQLQNNILSFAEKNKLEKNVIQISDGKLQFVETKNYPSLTFKYVEKSLSEIIHNPTQCSQIMQYLKEKREIKTVKEIKRFS